MAHATYGPSFRTGKYLTAPAIFENNDVKHETNKTRAVQHVSIEHKSITDVCAKDTPSADALREHPDLTASKLLWLQRHDRESCDLHGVLALSREKGCAVPLFLNSSLHISVLGIEKPLFAYLSSCRIALHTFA